MSNKSKYYLPITFAIMIICWGSCVIASVMGYAIGTSPFLYIPYLIGGFSPTIASYIVMKKEGEITSFKGWLKKVFDFKQSVASYIISILMIEFI